MAAISDGTICCVCAEPLEWTAFGVCNHKDTCSKCVARWRFVLKDNSCMMCKTELSSVYITRYMGDFTARLSPQDFDDLKARANRGELYYLPSIEGYTDDQAHYQLIKSLCGYTHPVIEEKCAVAQRAPPKFSSFEAMKGFIQNNYKLQFCNICVEGRKVFLCEQQLYTRFDLDKHNKTGDDEGPLAESGFKGHPMCHFCRTRFYDSNELYRHMEGSHEHCFICRRERPHQHVYYRHYKELEDHFRQDHFICPHPACLEARFVVFPTEHEMKRHFASEHGDELKMSRAQRREAMTIPVNLQFRSSADEEARALALARPGVVIGGGYNLAAPRRGGGRGGQAPLHHSSSEGQMQAALQASTEQGPSSVMFDASDFPAVSGGSGAPGGQFGRWSGIGAGPSSVVNQEEFPELPTMSKAAKKKMRQQIPLAAQLRAANMPVRVINRSAGAGPSGGSSSSSAAGGSGGGSGVQHPPDDPLPQLTAGPGRGGSGTGARHWRGQAAVRQQDVLAAQQERRSQQQQRQKQQSSRRPLLPRTPDLDASSGNDASSAEDEESTPLEDAVSGPSSTSRGRSDGGGRGTAAFGGSVGWDGGRLASGLAPSRSPPRPPSIEDEFPSLAPSSAARRRGARPPVPPPAPLHYEAVAGTPASRQSSSTAGAGSQQQQQPVVRPEDFPSLGGGPSVRPLSGGQWQQKSKKGGPKGPSSSNGTSSTSSSNRPSTVHSQAAPPPGSPRSPSANGVSSNGAGNGEAGSGSEQGSGSSVSDRLKAANKALISKIRTQLGGNGAQFSRFKAESGLFMRGELTPEQYHSSIVALGLLLVVPELAALCPGAEQRSELLRAHREYLASPAANNAGPGWVPPEAAAAMAAEAESRASWSCKRCTLVNAPEVSACEMCGATREGVIPALDAFPSLPSSGGASSSTRAPQGSTADGQYLASSAKGSKKGKGGTKITIGLGAGNARAAAEAVTADPSNVAWGGGGSGSSNNNAALRQAAQAQREALARPNGVRGQWAQSSANNLARQIGILNDAWGSR